MKVSSKNIICKSSPVFQCKSQGRINSSFRKGFSGKIETIKNTLPDFFLFKKPFSGFSSSGVVHLSDMKLEKHNGKTCVRCYCVVVDEQKISEIKQLGMNEIGKSKYKDVIMGAAGKIVFSEGGGWLVD